MKEVYIGNDDHKAPNVLASAFEGRDNPENIGKLQGSYPSDEQTRKSASYRKIGKASTGLHLQLKSLT